MNLKLFAVILDYVRSLINLAEASGQMGQEKKQFVMDETKKLCEQLNVKWETISGWVSVLIDIIVLIYNIVGIFKHTQK